MHQNVDGPAPDGAPAHCAAEGEKVLVRVRMDVAYDGTGFSGWAVQPGRRTVAGEICAALERICQTPISLTVAGRTDAGVHATGQVCHVDLPEAKWGAIADTVVRRLAGMLPTDVRVWTALPVHSEFDARFSALWRRYQYRVTDAPGGANPLRRLDTLAWQRPLELALLNAAAAGLTGEHDFAAFCRRKDFATTIREVTRLSWERADDGILVATVQADAFCQQMVRSLVGAMLTVGEGRRDPSWPAGLLTRVQRASDVPVAGAHGLTLVAVGYPGEDDYAQRADATRRLRTRRA